MSFHDDGAMPRIRMHDDEVFTDAGQVRRLIGAQFPQWSALPIRPVRSHGTDNTIWRLGDAKAIRMPRRPGAVVLIEKERRWLSFLASHLPVSIPEPLAKGTAGEGYPWPWSVCPWLEGDNPDPECLEDADALARDLAQFIVALRAIDPRGGPLPGRRNFGRGMPLALRDESTREALAALDGGIDVAAAAAAWDADLHAPAWPGPPVWIHGDLNPGNLLVRQARLSGVIDFGSLAVGDPACDLLAAWYVFPRDAREVFREALGADDASWARGRGWALSMALIALSYYKDTNPVIVAAAKRTIAEVLVGQGA